MESPFVSKETVEEVLASRNPFRHIRNIVATIENDIYYFEHIDSIPKRLTHTPVAKKSHVKLSKDKTKIVYLNSVGTPVVINAQTGALIETISNRSNVKQIGWTNDDHSIYMLVGKNVFIHGVPTTVTQPETYNQYDEVLSFSMNDRGDQAYYIKNAGLVSKKLKFDSQSQGIDTLITIFYGESFGADYIDFHGNDGGFVVGYNAYNANDITRISCFNDYKFWPEFDWAGVESWVDEIMLSPTFDQDSEVVLFGNRKGSTYSIKAVYLGTELYYGDGQQDIKMKVLDKYTSTQPIYLDWRQ